MISPIEISVVSPVYRGEITLPELVERITGALSLLTPQFEIVLIDDGSPDNSWEQICAAHQRNPRVRGLRLSRNFGQHNAISAGLRAARGEWIVVMDCDLQDQPEEISKLYARTKDGYDIVFARRMRRQDSFFKRAMSRTFFYCLSYLTELNLDASVGNFGICRRNVVDAINSLHEQIRWYPGMVRWVGFRASAVDVFHAQRAEGKSTYSLRKLVRLAIDVSLMSSEKPLRMTVKMGLGISLLSFCFGIYLIWESLSGAVGIVGWSSLIVSIWFLSGLIIFVLGIVGLYVGKIFNEVRGRPSYLIGETTSGELSS